MERVSAQKEYLALSVRRAKQRLHSQTFRQRCLSASIIAVYLLVEVLQMLVPVLSVLQASHVPQKTANDKYQVLPNNVHQVLASEPKADTTIRENIVAFKEASSSTSQASKKEIFRWFVTLPDKTVFSFGKQEKGGILPIVKVTNKDGWFVQYAPEMESFKKQNPQYVLPKVVKNVISWELADGVTARYTMSGDRVKADYIIRDKKALASTPLSFAVTYNHGKMNKDASTGDIAKAIGEGRGDLSYTIMPGGELSWLAEDGEELFTFPKPISVDASHHNVSTKYFMRDVKPGAAVLTLSLAPHDLATANYPLTIDPSVVATSTAAAATQYGNERKLLKDAWGNLIVVANIDASNNVYYKNAVSTTWVNSTINIDGGISSSVNEASDIDSAGNIHIFYQQSNSNAANYRKLSITRDGTNAITSMSISTSLLADIGTVTVAGTLRPSLIIANKGGGANVEKVAAMWQTNSSTRGEIRFMMCSVSDDCTVAANWYNASKEINGSGACGDAITSGAAGLANANTCKGTTDKIFNTATNTTHHAVLTQVPGRPKRSPAKVFSFINASSTYTDLPNTYDNNPATSSSINYTSSSDRLYIGSDTKFSKMAFNLTAGGSGFGIFDPVYWNGSIWNTLSIKDNTYNGPTNNFVQSGSMQFSEPGDWAQTTVNGVTKYWIAITGDSASGTISEIYLTDAMARALMIVGGYDGNVNLNAAYVSWDEVNNDRWERTICVDAIQSCSSAGAPGKTGSPWYTGGVVDTVGAKWSVFTNFPLSVATDTINNQVFIGYMSGSVVGSSDIAVKSIPNNKLIDTAANFQARSFPTETETATTTLSMTSDGADIYLFYVLSPGVNGLVYRKWSFNSNSWSASQQTFVNFQSTVQSPIHPQAIVSKAFGDTTAIDLIYTNNITTPEVDYERQYVNSADKTTTVSASADDAAESYCLTLNEPRTQVISGTTLTLGMNSNDSSCTSTLTSTQYVGMRFVSLSISPGAKISSAYLEFRVNNRNSTTGAITFNTYAEDTDNSAAYAAVGGSACGSSSNCIALRARSVSTVASVIDFSTNTYRIDVTALVQEVICRGASNTQPCVGSYNKAGAWSSGNALSLLLIPAAISDPNAQVAIDAFDGTPAFTPTLQVNCAGSSCGTGNGGSAYSMGVIDPATQKVQNMNHPFSSSEYSAVGTNDGWVASLSATMVASPSASAWPVFMFKKNNSANTNTYKIDAQVVTKTSSASAQIPIYLQVYRGGSTNAWVTQASDSTSAADTNVTLTSPTITTNLSEYYFNETPGIGTQYAACTTATANCWTYWRVYQGVSPIVPNYTLSIDYINITYTIPVTISRLVITLPGETFAAGVGNSGSPNAQTAGTSFAIGSITATDNTFTVDTSFSGSKTLVFSGPANAPNTQAPSYTTTVSFTSGVSTTTLTTILYKAELPTITVTSGGSYGYASSVVTVNAAALSTNATDSPVTLSVANIGINTNVQVTARMRDVYQNPLSISGSNIVFTGTTASFVQTRPPSATDASGNSIAYLQWSTAGVKTMTVLVNGSTLLSAPTITIVAQGNPKTKLQGGTTIRGGTSL